MSNIQNNQSKKLNQRRTNSNTNEQGNNFQNNSIQQNNMNVSDNNQTMQSDNSKSNRGIVANNNKEFLSLAQKVECSGKIPTARFGHIMVLVSDTKAVLFGGAVGDTRNFSITNDTFSFNIMTKIWTKLNSILFY